MKTAYNMVLTIVRLGIETISSGNSVYAPPGSSQPGNKMV